MTWFTELFERAGIKRLAEREAGVLARGEPVAKYTKIFNHELHRQTTRSGVKLVTLGRELPSDVMETISNRVDAFALAYPRAARRLNKVQLVNSAGADISQLRADVSLGAVGRRSEGTPWGPTVARRRRAMHAGRDPEILEKFSKGTATHVPGAVRSFGVRSNAKVVMDVGSIMGTYGKGAQDWSVASRATSRQELLDRVLTHELGHELHTSYADALSPYFEYRLPGGMSAQELGTTLGSEYGTDRDTEAFAELYSASVHEPARLGLREYDVLHNRAPGQGESARAPAAHQYRSSARMRPPTPDQSLNTRRHSTARSGLPVRSSATGRF